MKIEELTKAILALTEDDAKKLTRAITKKESAFPVPIGVQFSVGRNTKNGFSVFAGVQPFGANPVFSFKNEALADEVCTHISKNFWFIRKAIEFSMLDAKLVKDTFVFYDTKIMAWSPYDDTMGTPTEIGMSITAAQTFVKWLEEYAPNGYLLEIKDEPNKIQP